MEKTIVWRETVTEADRQNVREILDSTGFFTAEEITVAIELVDEALAKGSSSWYRFLFAEIDGRTLGYTCFGQIACTVASHDLYWIGVHQDSRNFGIGKKLLGRSEEMIRALAGKRIYIETSSRPLYEPTRAFYLKCDYQIDAILKDFYAPDDGKVIFVKAL